MLYYIIGQLVGDSTLICDALPIVGHTHMFFPSCHCGPDRSHIFRAPCYIVGLIEYDSSRG